MIKVRESKNKLIAIYTRTRNNTKIRKKGQQNTQKVKEMG